MRADVENKHYAGTCVHLEPGLFSKETHVPICIELVSNFVREHFLFEQSCMSLKRTYAFINDAVDQSSNREHVQLHV